MMFERQPRETTTSYPYVQTLSVKMTAVKLFPLLPYLSVAKFEHTYTVIERWRDEGGEE